MTAPRTPVTPRPLRLDRRGLTQCLLALVLLLASAACSGGTGSPSGSDHTASPSPSPSPSGTPPPTSPPNPDMGTGVYLGSNSSQIYHSIFGRYANVETTYLNADQVSTPDPYRFEQEIRLGISPVITLDYKDGPFTRAQIADWGPEVRTYFTGFVAGLKRLSDYATSQHNGTRVYFADEHEAAIKITQHKYTYSGYGAAEVPTIAESAAAWNQVTGYVAKAAPDVVRVYWFGGTGAGEDEFAAALDPRLIQLATFDLYRWRYDGANDTPAGLWGGTVAHLEAQSWMRKPNGTLKPWGVTEWGTDASFGDASNATFITAALTFWRDQGAAFAVYFDRVDANNRANDFQFTNGDRPHTLEAYRSAVAG